MTVTAEKIGRNLHITVEGVDPFVIRPLPGWAGIQLTETYLEVSAGHIPIEGMETLLMHAADGVDEDDQWIENGPVYQATQKHLSLAEAQDVLVPALFWQTVLGIKGVNIYLNSGGGDTGTVKALWSLASSLGRSASLISPNSALETLIQTLGSTPSTSTPQGGEKPGKQPQDRLPKQPPQTD